MGDYKIPFKYYGTKSTNNKDYPWQIPEDKYALDNKLLKEDGSYAMIERRVASIQKQIDPKTRQDMERGGRPGKQMKMTMLYNTNLEQGSVPMEDRQPGNMNPVPQVAPVHVAAPNDRIERALEGNIPMGVVGGITGGALRVLGVALRDTANFVGSALYKVGESAEEEAAGFNEGVKKAAGYVGSALVNAATRKDDGIPRDRFGRTTVQQRRARQLQHEARKSVALKRLQRTFRRWDTMGFQDSLTPEQAETTPKRAATNI